jgi:hypothetical protein
MAAAVKRVTECLLAEQFTDGNALGAWSRAYPAYLQYVFGDRIPCDVSVRDSITCSSWIARALAVVMQNGDDDLARAIRPRITAYVDYLLRHQDRDSGGFGLSAKPTSRGVGGVAVDLRHTAWAMLSLARLDPRQPEVAEPLRRASSFVQERLESATAERTITVAVLHCLLSSPETGPLVIPVENARRAALKRLESRIVEAFDPVYGSWDTAYDLPRLAAIDNAFFVLYAMRIRDCVDAECADTLRASFDKLMQIGSHGTMPFELGGMPDVGATTMLAFLLSRNADELSVRQRDIDRIVSCAVEGAVSSADLGYPWHVAQLLRIALGDM